MRWLFVLMALLLLSVAGLWATGASTPRADVVFVNGAELRTLDPQRISWSEDYRIGRCLFEPLIGHRLPEMTLEPVLAQRYEISDDQRTYTFFLRPDAQWSSGEPVTAHDLLYAWRRAISPDLAADYSELLFVIDGASDFFEFRSKQLKDYAKTDVASRPDPRVLWQQAIENFDQHVAIKAIDARTLQVRLAQPVAYFLELCAFITFAPVHEKSVEAQITYDPATARRIQDPLWTRPDRLITNGPYVLAMRRFKRDLLLTANPHYWNRAAMRNQSILQLVISDPMTQLLAYRRGQVDWLPDIPSTSPLAADLLVDQRAGRRDDVHLSFKAGTYFYNFNCKPKRADGSPNPLADPRVRRALALGIDRATIVEKVTRLGQPPARTFVPPGSLPGYDAPVDAGAWFDIQQARDLLKEAGFPGGNGLSGLSILYNTEGAHATIAQQIKRTWEDQLGVVVSLQGVEKNVFGQKLRNHDFDIARAAWFGDYRDPTTFLDKFISTNGNNDAAYENTKFDDLMKQAASATDPATRLALLRDAEAMMLREAPIAPIFHYALLSVFDPAKVQGLHLNAWDFRRLEFVHVQR